MQMRDEFWDTAPHYGGRKGTRFICFHIMHALAHMHSLVICFIVCQTSPGLRFQNRRVMLWQPLFLPSSRECIEMVILILLTILKLLAYVRIWNMVQIHTWDHLPCYQGKLPVMSIA